MTCWADQQVQIVTHEGKQEPAPEYTDHDLNRLTSFFKSITTLYDLRETDWNESNEEPIRNFILTPSETILVLYFDQDNLRADFLFPKVPFVDLFYFIRKPGYVFEVETFHENVTFGNIHENIEWSILNVIENVFAPIALSATDWPDSIL